MAAADRNTILYIGLNPGAAHEAKGLRGFGSRVLYIGNSREADHVFFRGQSHDLATEAGRAALAGALRLTEHQREIVSSVLEDAFRNGRDELGKLVLRWAAAEHGGTTPSRLVISSHSAGTGDFWGDKNGVISFTQVKRLTSAFPRAAAAIEHLHFAACYSAQGMMDWTTVFPNLQTIWAYSGSAPGSASGSLAHLRIWERGTRSSRTRLHRAEAESTRKGGNVTVWSRMYGREEQAVEDIDTIRAREAADRHIFDEFFAGDQIVVDTDSGPLRDYYNTIQAFLNHPLLQAAERPALEKKRERTVRLIFYQKEIRKKFQQAYAREITTGFRALDLPVPNFASLDRKQAVAAIQAFQKKAGTRPPAAAKECLRLIQGLYDLDPQIIPLNWI